MSYQVNEVFYSLQGEGARAGTANVFVRFSGCNLRCARETHGFDCDTEFASGRRLGVAELIDEIRRAGGACRNVILTGGEPLLQVDPALVAALRAMGFWLAVETNGTRAVPEGISWVSLSPKVAEHAIQAQRADEIRYVRAAGQGIPRPPQKLAEGARLFVSPAFDGDQPDKAAFAWCVQLVKENPEWALSVQQHKAWCVR